MHLALNIAGFSIHFQSHSCTICFLIAVLYEEKFIAKYNRNPFQKLFMYFTLIVALDS